MIKRVLLIIFFSFIIFLNGCSNDNSYPKLDTINEAPETLYELAMIDLENDLLDNAEKKFKNIDFKYPLSNEAIQSQIMLGFIEYLRLNYEEAIFKFNRIINRFPSHKNIDYVYYMRALSYFEQIRNEKLDANKNLQALKNFNQIINRFPKSKYSKDSNQKIILIKENIAAKHMDIAMFYHKQRKYTAALKRFNIVINDYSYSKFTPEALFRMVEIYYTLGLDEDARKTASVIGFNYPDSKWYKYSYDLINNEQNISEKRSLFSKISNLLTNDDKKD